jgi:TolA-binding protein
MLDQAGQQFSVAAQELKATFYGDQCLVGLGVVRQRNGRYDEALQAFTDVVSRRTDELGAEAQYRIGETLFAQRRYREAIPALMRVPEAFPNAKDFIAESYLKAGECHLKLGEKAKAIKAYQSVLKSHRSDNFAREAERRLKELQGV